ncbi:class I SAM-dependent methyltransferase, partial [Qipengyuania pacifica]|uniref:class I SAM-dependent methyltransferase n=1 Tax=Qipengyuania pacifica TaxID=2860199 RepID=UPI0035C7C9D3
MKAWYDDHVMPRVITAACGQKGIEKRRRQIVPLARGRVFEIGCGGGLNQALYDADAVTSFSGIDPHAKLLDGARKRARAKGWNVDIRQGVGENIPFPDGSFDTVVCTYTLCSV